MKKYAIVVSSVLLLVFLVLPLTVQAEKGKCGKDMKGDGILMGKGPHGLELFRDLDEDILKKMQEMRLKNKEKMLDLRTEIGKRKLEMEKVLIEKELNFKKILSIHDEISKLEQEISRKRIEHKIEMYKLLPEDKKEMAKKMFLHGFLDRKHGGPGMHNFRGEPEHLMKK